MSGQTSDDRRQVLTYASCSASAIVLTAIIALFSDNPFRPYFGAFNPLLVVTLTAAIGAVSLTYLFRRGLFVVVSSRVRSGMSRAAVLATLFGIVVVPADILIRFPEEMNVALPQALLFYPAVAFVVEVMFHALPLAVLLAISSPFFARNRRNALIWACILVAATLEPILQVQLGFPGRPLSWAEVFVATHLFLFNLAQLYLYRRYDFVSMFALRLVYYLYWHIIWGYLRLQWLF